MTDLCYLELVPDGKGSEGMLTVDHYELIRRKVEIAGETQRDVAKELGHPKVGTLRYIDILMLLTEYPEAQVKAAVKLCVRLRAFSKDAVLNVLRNEPLSKRGRLDLSNWPELVMQGNGVRDTGIYDQLKAREGVLV